MPAQRCDHAGSQSPSELAIFCELIRLLSLPSSTALPVIPV